MVHSIWSLACLQIDVAEGDQKMETAMTLMAVIGAMMLSLVLTFIAGEFVLKGFFKALYAGQKTSPPSW